MTAATTVRRRMARLGECCEVVSGSTPSRERPEYWGGEIPWATPRDLSALEEPVLHETTERITKQGYESCSTSLLPVGAVLFSSRAPVGLVAIAGRAMCTNQGFKSLIPGSDLDSGYLYWCLRRFGRAIERRGSGTTFTEVSKEVISRFEIPIPPLADQRRIATVLDKADGVRRKRRESLRLLDEFLRSAFLEMFGDPVRNEKGWPKMPIADLGRVITGSTPPTEDPQNYADEGLPFVRPTELDSLLPVDRSSKNVAKRGQRTVDVLPAESVLFCGIGATIGKTGYTGVPACVNQQIHAIVPDRGLVNSVYVFMAIRLARHAIVARATTTTLPILKKSAFEQYRVPVPPLSLLDRYAKLFDSSVRTIRRVLQAEQAANLLFESLAQRAFTDDLAAGPSIALRGLGVS